MFTTHTPRFLGLNRGSGIWPTASYGKDVIIGIIDTGIWPESQSFNDNGISKVPSRWKGKCENGTACSPSIYNNKLIGARSFSKGIQATSINISTEVDFAGINIQTSRVTTCIHRPQPRVTTCMVLVTLAMQKGSQGVRTDTFLYVIAIASLSAIEKGIVVVCSAGNNGPGSATLKNGAPWIMTVGAGTMDRSYIATLELGNEMAFEGTSYFPTSVSISNRRLYSGSNDTKTAGCSFFIPNYSISGVLLHTRYAKAIKEYAIRDILAPGVDVLGAVRPDVPFMEAGKYNLVTDNALYSGTSMAAPHVAGDAALVKAVHRNWSPSAIRSAMITTATKIDNTHGSIRDQWNGLAATPLEFGAGHVNPDRAMDPGLIYDMGPQDYIDFLCGLGYTAKQMSTILRTSQWSCENQTDLNYPSFIANFSNQTTSWSEKHLIRTVTNVGDHVST
ncbi:hypothetical protein L1987_23126 [Smallanthus sonchifolius]|uniref:Uncharacterized protein n=1 Tax=Smallanthus sonchifolius TaxID=185202 RepID=A0ACB9IHD2_9ASTR|nr:hypothetical protein L1987_23126 [Smallanthus sonchifolius]